MISKIKIYLDTSVISYLLQEDSPKKMEETNNVWNLFEKDLYDIYISSVTIVELKKCKTEKRDNLLTKLQLIKYSLLEF